MKITKRDLKKMIMEVLQETNGVSPFTDPTEAPDPVAATKAPQVPAQGEGEPRRTGASLEDLTGATRLRTLMQNRQVGEFVKELERVLGSNAAAKNAKAMAGLLTDLGLPVAAMGQLVALMRKAEQEEAAASTGA